MLLRRFYDTGLAQASYLLGCQATGHALVVDPNRDVQQYLEAAKAEGVRLTHVTETHIHADFVSGSRELAERAGARLLLSAEGGQDWRYAFARDANATLLHDNDVFEVGNIRVQALHTPGHTPEHLSFLVTDTRATALPVGLLTGDFVFVGDVGRPDLLERAAGIADTMEESARALFRSLDRFRGFADYVQVWPGHGAGSACGKALGAVPMSTVGYERIANWALAITDEASFVREVLAGQPEPPRYFAMMKRVNRDGPALLGALPRPARLPDDSLGRALDEGVIVDLRRTAEYASGHVPGTINIPLNDKFSTWAGSLVPYDHDVYLVADDESGDAAARAARALALIGIDRVRGWFRTRALEVWAGDRALQQTPQLTVDELARLGGAAIVVDVRGRSEYEAGHIPGTTNVPLAELGERLADIPRGRPLILHCQGGTRSSIAASVLLARGFHDIANLSGGFTAWEKGGHPVEKTEGEPAASE
jgi:hydroxyacylglutathione hydrolase